MTRAIWISILVLASLATSGRSVRADLPPGWPNSNRSGETPPPAPAPIDPITDKPLSESREEKKPRRNGPFRSCGSGAGTGFAAIGVLWAMLWVGTRVVGRVRGTKDQPPR